MMKLLVVPSSRSRWSKRAIFFAALVMILWIGNSINMVKRASHSGSDVGVFYQTAVLLNQGGGAEVYGAKGLFHGWFRCIPPAGLAFFQPLAHFGPGVAGFLWMLLNWAMLAAAIVMLRRFLGRLDHQRRLYQSLFPYAAILLVLMSLGSIQVGQFSLLFTACWIGYLLANTRDRGFWMGLSLALPSAIKIYPVLLLMVPLSVRGRRGFREMGFFALGIVLLCGVVPTLFNGVRVVELTTSFLREVVFNPNGRMSENFRVGSVSNQGLESIFLRYLSYDPQFHAEYPRFPHLLWPHEQVLHLANWIRLVIFAISAGVAFRWRHRALLPPIYAALCMAALWTATLILIMPGPKARYGVYAYVAFLPLLGQIAAAARQPNRLAHRLLLGWTVVFVGLISQFIPDGMRACGFGFIGSLGLWGTNLWLLIRQAKIRPSIPGVNPGATAQNRFGDFPDNVDNRRNKIRAFE